MIQVERAISELSFERYTFYFDNTTLYLNTYTVFSKEDKRKRKWNLVKKYDRLSERDSSLKEKDVELTQSVKAEALELLKSKLRCIKWSERLSK